MFRLIQFMYAHVFWGQLISLPKYIRGSLRVKSIFCICYKSRHCIQINNNLLSSDDWVLPLFFFQLGYQKKPGTHLPLLSFIFSKQKSYYLQLLLLLNWDINQTRSWFSLTSTLLVTVISTFSFRGRIP